MKTRRLGSLAAAAALAAVPAGAIASAPKTVLGTGHVKRGTVLVTSRGRTLYMTTHDRGSSTCYGSCARTWSPLLASGSLAAKSGSGLKQSLLGKTRRRDGKIQVTYNHHPLYTYSGDKRAGDMHGQGLKQFGGTWYVVGKSGNALKPSSGGGGNCPGCPQGY
jgi:predicted lipoprotein with Yx(FWY)xxD motif